MWRTAQSLTATNRHSVLCKTGAAVHQEKMITSAIEKQKVRKTNHFLWERCKMPATFVLTEHFLTLSHTLSLSDTLTNSLAHTEARGNEC